MSRLDLVWVNVRALLVHVRVVREERTQRDLVLVRDGVAEVPLLHDICLRAILAFDTQAEDLCHTFTSQP